LKIIFCFCILISIQMIELMTLNRTFKTEYNMSYVNSTPSRKTVPLLQLPLSASCDFLIALEASGCFGPSSKIIRRKPFASTFDISRKEEMQRSEEHTAELQS